MLMKQGLLIIGILFFLTCFIWSIGFGTIWYHRVFGLIYAFASIEIISLIGYLILKFKLTYDKKRIFS